MKTKLPPLIVWFSEALSEGVKTITFSRGPKFKGGPAIEKKKNIFHRALKIF
jgi:hypothetical protein